MQNAGLPSTVYIVHTSDSYSIHIIYTQGLLGEVPNSMEGVVMTVELLQDASQWFPGGSKEMRVRMNVVCGFALCEGVGHFGDGYSTLIHMYTMYMYMYIISLAEQRGLAC